MQLGLLENVKMKQRSPKILYFSLIESRATSFWEWVNKEGCNYCKNAIFSKVKTSAKFTHAADLPLFLDQYNEDLPSLHVIIDYDSIANDDVDIIRNTIIEYPEVQFLFDNHYSTELSLSSFLFPQKELQSYISSYSDQEKKVINNRWEDISQHIDYSLLEIHLKNPHDEFNSSLLFSRIINGLDNTFDGSNLRYAIKYRKRLHLKVQNNFEKAQESRYNNIAICIEEESRQNVVNAYSLYSNGYRVLPITTSQELELVNKSIKINLASNGIIIRDYDLQFEDEDSNSVDEIRGFRYCEKEDLKKDSAFALRAGKYLKYYKQGWNILIEQINPKYQVTNKFWDELIRLKYPLYFITKGPKLSNIDHPERNRELFINNKTGELHLPGLAKPVCGIYSPFQGLPEVKKTYHDTRYSLSDKKTYEISTSRKDHDHSTPLDIYDMANNMIRRAELYYNEKKYLLAALVSGETIEILNGFHHRLLIKAYYTQSIAENAIAMDAVGSNEIYLAKDAQFRVDKIIEDVNRFLYGYEEKSKWNTLNHIFSTCRQFCKEHEHFDSESVFISAIGHLNEGYNISDIFDGFSYLIQKAKNEIISFCRLIKNWKKEKNDNGQQRKD